MILNGDGLSKVLLLSEDRTEQDHWMLDRLLKRAGIAREQFYFAIPEDGWYAEASAKGVKTVVALGEMPLRRAVHESDIFRWRGRVVQDQEWPWFIIPTFKPSHLIHRRQPPPPAPRDKEIFRNPPRYQGRWMRDLHYALQVAREGFTRRPVRYLLDPSPEVFLRWVEEFLRAYAADPTLKLSFDIETPYKRKKEQEDELEESEQVADLNTTILRISFSYRECEAVTVPAAGPYWPAIKMALACTSDKVCWNGLTFDIPVLRKADAPTNGRIFDGMDAFKWWQTDLDRGLEAASADTTDVLPWKHLSEARPDWYNAADSDVALRATNYIIAQIREQGSYQNYLETFVELMPMLHEAGDHGNSIDLDYQKVLRGEMDLEQARLEREIQRVVPEHLKPRAHYKRIPDVNIKQGWTDTRYETVDGRIFVPVTVDAPVKVCTRCGARDVTKGEHTAKKSLGKRLIEEKHHKKCILSGELAEAVWPKEMLVCSCAEHAKGWPKKVWDVTPNPCHGADIEVRILPTQEWDEILSFNAASSQQLIVYMKAFKHPVGTGKDDPDKEGADAKHLTLLKKKYGKKHPLYGLALDKHKVDKARSTYLWVPRDDGKIGQTYKNTPSTIRLAGCANNLMNVGKRYDPEDPETGNVWAWKARNQLVASPGCVLVQADSSSVEGVMQGWYMGSPKFMDLANKSVHAWLVCMKLGWDFNPDNVKKVKAEHHNLYDAMKVMNYRTLFGGSAFSAWKDNPDVFPTLKSAEDAQGTIFRLLPELEAYQYNVRVRAHKQGYLQSPWGVRHHFYDVFTYARDRAGELQYTPGGFPKLKLGKDGKRAVAFEPQHSNALFGRQNLRQMYLSEWRPYMPANLFVHDGYVLDCPTHLADKAVEFMGNLLTRPIPEMGGLRVGCEVEIGTNWGAYHAVHNPNGMKGVHKIVISEQHLSWMPKNPAEEKKVAA